jgi:hypothetical protein
MKESHVISGDLDGGRVTFERPPASGGGGGPGPSDVALNEEEIRALCWALDNYLPGLRFDEARVKLARDRHYLVVREEILTSLRQRLGHALERTAETSGPHP